MPSPESAPARPAPEPPGASGTADGVAAPVLSRRAAVAGAGLAAAGIGLLAAGCGSSGSGSAPAAAGTALGPTSAVPVGSAAVFPGVIVTQPTAGTYQGFSSVCPHQGCEVSEVQGASLVCPCHGSTFGLDGAVESGPAQTGLTARAVTVSDGQIVVG